MNVKRTKGLKAKKVNFICVKKIILAPERLQSALDKFIFMYLSEYIKHRYTNEGIVKQSNRMSNGSIYKESIMYNTNN